MTPTAQLTAATPDLTARARISCVICAYNEADHIASILRAVQDHPALHEVIVVDDGSTDGTAELAASFPGVRVMSYRPNRGKTYALSQGMAAASGDYLMLLDADLEGVTAADIQALAEPVIGGRAVVSLSLRGNSLAIYRAMGLDFVSGERLLPRRLVAPSLTAMEALPRWGGEVFINSLIMREALSIAVVDWRGVVNIRKTQKVGAWQGWLDELSMTGDVLRVLPPVSVVRQNLAMLRLKVRAPRPARPRRFALPAMRRLGAFSRA